MTPEQERAEASLCKHGNYHCSICEVKLLKLTVEQLIAENERLKEREFNHYPIVIHELESRIFNLQEKVAEQDKELQRLREALEHIYEVETDSYEMDKELMFNIARDALS